jgi:hypothetical protein
MNLREAILQIVTDPLKMKDMKLAKVISVSGYVCTVKTINDEVELSGVRLQTADAAGMYLKPAVDSIVMIANIADYDFAVIMYSELESIKLLDGSYGGLTKTQELKTQLDKTNEVLQAVVDSLKNWVVVPNDGGAALKTFFNTQLGVKVVGDYSQIENTDITHGTV